MIVHSRDIILTAGDFIKQEIVYCSDSIVLYIIYVVQGLRSLLEWKMRYKLLL